MKDPILLTPGPLTTSRSVKEAMLRDWGSRDPAFIDMNTTLRTRLPRLAGAEETHVCVPVQGSGTFAVEATIGTLLPRDGKLLVLINGAYGVRMKAIASVMGRAVESIDWPEDEPVEAEALDRRLADDPTISHVAVVHCETTTGILNPVEAIAATVATHGRRLLIDAMSAFGAIPIDVRKTPFVALMASSNKCLEGAPGMGFALIRRETLEACKGNAHSLSLDLFAQQRGFEANAQWRFTPPTHVIAAFARALEEHEQEGGVAGRGARYQANHRLLVDGMEALGFRCLLPHALQAPIIVTFHMPADPAFVFSDFYERLRAKGFIIYPGKLTVAVTFRMGCIGRIGADDIRAALAAVRATMSEMGVASGAPAPASREGAPLRSGDGRTEGGGVRIRARGGGCDVRDRAPPGDRALTPSPAKRRRHEGRTGNVKATGDLIADREGSPRSSGRPRPIPASRRRPVDAQRGRRVSPAMVTTTSRQRHPSARRRPSADRIGEGLAACRRDAPPSPTDVECIASWPPGTEW